MKRTTHTLALAPLTLLALGMSGCGTAAPEADRPVDRASRAPHSAPLVTEDPARGAPAPVGGMERYLSLTLDDWQAYTDVLVLARVTGEERTAQPAPEPGTPETEGADLVGRTIEVEVTRTIWSDPDSERRPERNFSMAAAGWLEDADTATEIVMGTGARLEVGHDYIMALLWYPREFSEGDPPEPAKWGLIGSGGVLPADGGVIGEGEYLGVDGVDEDAIPRGSMLALHLGEPVEEFIDSMEGFRRIEREPVVEAPGG